MTTSAHKTDLSNHTKPMRSHHFVLTGNASRKGKRIPLNEIKYNEQRDALRLNPQSGGLCGARLTSPQDLLTGYGYFGARYMDYTLMTMFISVDRYASKYPFISPYAYCAWNPIRLIDPSGDSIIVCPQNRKDGNEKLLSSLSEKTGLRLFVDENGRMQYEKDGNGDPIVNRGSKTAREDMKKLSVILNLTLYYNIKMEMLQ